MVAPPPDGGASAGRPPESSPAPRRRRTAFSGAGWGTPGLHPGRADFFCATSRCSAHILASAAGSTGEGRRPSRQDGRDVSGKTGDPCLLFAHAPIAGVHDLHPARAHRPGSPRAAGLRLLPGDHPQRGGQPSRSTPLEHRLNVSGLEEARRPEDFNRSASISLDRRLPDAALSPEFLDKRERPPGVDRWRGAHRRRQELFRPRPWAARPSTPVTRCQSPAQRPRRLTPHFRFHARRQPRGVETYPISYICPHTYPLLHFRHARRQGPQAGACVTPKTD